VWCEGEQGSTAIQRATETPPRMRPHFLVIAAGDPYTRCGSPALGLPIPNPHGTLHRVNRGDWIFPRSQSLFFVPVLYKVISCLVSQLLATKLQVRKRQILPQLVSHLLVATIYQLDGSISLHPSFLVKLVLAEFDAMASHACFFPRSRAAERGIVGGARRPRNLGRRMMGQNGIERGKTSVKNS
jgi:hypothetical protein